MFAVNQPLVAQHGGRRFRLLKISPFYTLVGRFAILIVHLKTPSRIADCMSTASQSILAPLIAVSGGSPAYLPPSLLNT